jgi:hypothetical protein
VATYPTSPKPHYEYVEEVEFNVAITTYPNGHEQRILAGPSDGVVTITLNYGRLLEADMDVLWNFFKARSGPLESFNYTSIRDATPYVVRFGTNMMSRTLFQRLVEKTGVKLVQVYGETPAA